MADRRQTEREIIAEWFDTLRLYKDNWPARGTIAAALVVLEHLKTNFDLSLGTHRAKGGSQLRGVSGRAAARILARFGEQRPFLSEGGRTNRGGPGEIETMLVAVASMRLNDLPEDERVEALTRLQAFLAEKVNEFHSRQRIKISYDSAKTSWQFFRDLLNKAADTGREGPVAQYLVGAKLQLRYPELAIGNESYSTADAQLGRRGDFQLADTAFHVTVAPMPGVYEKCKTNMDLGLRVFLLVPDRVLAGSRQNAEMVASGRIAVESLESFLSQNIEELSTFSGEQRRQELRRLIDTYNARVNQVENDKSLLLELPDNLV